MKLFRMLNDGYTVTTDQELISELFENEIESLNGKKRHYINWFNFNQGNIYYDNNGEIYQIKNIDHVNKTVKLL